MVCQLGLATLKLSCGRETCVRNLRCKPPKLPPMNYYTISTTPTPPPSRLPHHLSHCSQSPPASPTSVLTPFPSTCDPS